MKTNLINDLKKAKTMYFTERFNGYKRAFQNLFLGQVAIIKTENLSKDNKMIADQLADIFENEKVSNIRIAEQTKENRTMFQLCFTVNQTEYLIRIIKTTTDK